MVQQKRRSPEGSVRITGGTHRSRKIPVIDIQGLRPTGDRLRETLFSWLMPHLEGAKVLDAFAGSGILSFEALSRGAEQALLLDNSSTAVEQLKKSAVMLDAKVDVRCQDALQFFSSKNTTPHTTFNIIFLDPPFSEGLMQKSIDSLATSNLLSPRAMIYLEQASSQEQAVPPSNWNLHREKTIGEVSCFLYQRQPNEDGKLSLSSK
jgi:16S rRNA (guanine966-N2)-methyltransferase